MVPSPLWHGFKNNLLKISTSSYLLRNLKLSFDKWHGLENDLLKVSNFSYLLKSLKLLKSEIVLLCTKHIFKVRTLLRISKVFFYPSNSYYLKLVPCGPSMFVFWESTGNPPGIHLLRSDLNYW